jgi:hypothetical protein
MQPACLFLIVVLGICALWLILKEPRAPFYQVPNPEWRYKTPYPTPQDYAAANYLADRFFPTKRNTITSTLF